MKISGKFSFLSAILLTSVNILSAQDNTTISLPSIFSDHIVLQQQDSVPVWGWGSPEGTVRIVSSWAQKDTISVNVDNNGRWKGRIKTGMHGGPYTLSFFQGKGNQAQIILEDVMLGEVWLCSGQSNMEWSPSNGILNQQEEISAADYPQIRFFSVSKRGSGTLQDDCHAIWESSTPEVMKRRSAAAYFFGRHLHRELNVPIGLIVSAWGGTALEVWLPEESVPDTPEEQKIIAGRRNPWWPIAPGTLYNSMIYPLFPYSIAGAIWYQGESNRDNPQTYAARMEEFIGTLRKGFEKDFPFYQVQIAPFNYKSGDNGPALVREAQEQVMRNVPRTGLVVTNDIGEYGNIHPARKQDIGKRLGNMALGEHYGLHKSGYQSPFIERWIVENRKAVLFFSNVEEGLSLTGKDAEGFVIAGPDGVFVKARARVKGNRIEVSAPEVRMPAAVKYCFDDSTSGNVVNSIGLPLAPFRINLDNK